MRIRFKDIPWSGQAQLHITVVKLTVSMSKVDRVIEKDTSFTATVLQRFICQKLSLVHVPRYAVTSFLDPE
jgi:hypothetical protein